jgi:hypothetical protein
MSNPTLDVSNDSRQDRGANGAAPPLDVSKFVAAGDREFLGYVLLMLPEKIGRKDFRAVKMRVRFGPLVDASQHQGWDKRHRRERCCGQPVWGPVRSNRCDDRYTGSEVTQNIAKVLFVYRHLCLLQQEGE